MSYTVEQFAKDLETVIRNDLRWSAALTIAPIVGRERAWELVRDKTDAQVVEFLRSFYRNEGESCESDECTVRGICR